MTRLATCINYVDLNNSMLRMHGHVSIGFFHCDVVFLQGNAMVLVILLQVRKVNFLNR